MADTAATATNRTWQPVTLGTGHGRNSVIWHYDRVDQPARWKKAGRVLVPHLFHPLVPKSFITRVFDVMEANANITFVASTEHAARMRDFVQEREAQMRQEAARFDVPPDDGIHASPAAKSARARAAKPPANIWLGVTVNDQWTAKTRIPALLETPAATRVVVCEPLTGPVDLDPFLTERRDVTHPDADAPEDAVVDGMVRHGDQWHRTERLHWVIAGGGFGLNARPLHPQWARDIRDACEQHSVPFYFTQQGDYVTASVVDDPAFGGGRAYDDPLHGGRSSASLRERGPSRTFRSGPWRAMEPGDRTRHTWMLDKDTIAVRVGRKSAGRELDGRLHDGVPDSSTATMPSAEAAATH
jgi:protein gp37